jgi:HNH endonuclease
MTATATSRVKGPKHPEGCLFCRRDDGGFTSREHIFSEALGNETYILDPGIVCDRCNNGPLSRADDALINFPGITLLRAERGLPTKAGKPVVSKWGNATIAFSGHGELEVINPGKKAMRRMPPSGRMPPEGGKMDLTTGGPLTADRIRAMVRSVWKSALELIYWDHGDEFAFDEVFDPARQAIIGSDKAQGWAVVPKETLTRPDVSLEYNLKIIGDRKAVPVHYNVFGVEFYTDLLRRDIPEEKITPPWEANRWMF